MKSSIYYLFLFFVLLGCSSSEENTITPKVMNVTTVASKTSVTVDEIFSVAVSSDAVIKSIGVTTDGSDPLNFTSSNFGTSTTLYFSFDTLGTKTIKVKVQNEKDETVVKTIVINVERGTAVKITGLQVKSFYNKDKTWDPEFAATDNNRLADVFFGIGKLKVKDPFSSSPSLMGAWYRSATKENQGDLTWDLAAANLYVNPSSNLYFSLVDQDGQVGQDLLLGSPDYRTFSFSSFAANKTKTITYTFADINLEFTFTVEWP